MPDRAVLLGVNAYKNFSSLRGCVNDVQNMRDLLTEKFGFAPANVKMLLDDKVVKTEVNKLKKWLLKDAKPGDRLVLHFSGHGSQIPADHEEDGVAEMICLQNMDFHDPGTFLTSVEMREWTKGLPEGCQLTIVFDSCHSGHGTRMLVNAEASSRGVSMLVDLGTGLQRAQARAGGLGVVPRDLAARVSDPDHEDLVRVRYIDPPPDVQAEIQRRLRLGLTRRELVRVDVNHVLLAACRKDQTAADATIQGTPNGAFTFHLCKVLREGGANLERKVLIKRIEAAMAAEHFDQSPQLETGVPEGPLFAGAKDPETQQGATERPSTEVPSDGTPVRPPAGGSTSWSAEGWQGVFHELAKMPAAAQMLALEILRAKPRSEAARARQIAAGTRVLVYVHGICKHVPGFSNDMWGALHPFTTVFGDGDLGDTRLEVVWSDLVNEKGLTLRAARAPASREVTEHERAKREVIETLQDRLDRHALEALPRASPGEAPRALPGARGLPSIPGLNCIDDFMVYLTNDNTRAEIIGRFTDVVRPLLEGGAAVDVISHSWGTVVAYEGLRQLEDEGLVTPGVNNFFTVGAALSISPVKARLRPDNRDGRRPAMVKHWVNVNARGDLVGGPLKDRPYAVDDDFPAVTPFGCPSFLNVVTPQCAHGSYFVDGNVEVNRDVFAKEINDA
jgi:hypothetical protein